jgi:hypothetical protein
VLKLIKWLFLIGFVGVLLAGGSYAVARFKVGRLVGPQPPLAGRTVEFAYRGVEGLPGRPRLWVVTATIYVSPTGNLVATRPADLEARLAAWEQSQEP